MIALEKARRMIGEAPTDPNSQILQQLLHSLESNTPFALAKIYEMDYAGFELGLEIIEGWRLHRFGRSVRKQARGLVDIGGQLRAEGVAASRSSALP